MAQPLPAPRRAHGMVDSQHGRDEQRHKRSGRVEHHGRALEVVVLAVTGSWQGDEPYVGGRVSREAGAEGEVPAPMLPADQQRHSH